MSIYQPSFYKCQTIPDPSSGNAIITFIPNAADHHLVPHETHDNTDVVPQLDGPLPSPPSNRDLAPLVQAVDQPLRCNV